MIAKFLSMVMTWALSKNAPGGYQGEDDLRWAYTIVVDGKSYLQRLLFPRVLGVRPMLHHFLLPDAGRHLHCHPWRWGLSIVLCGEYVELRFNRAGLFRSSRMMYDGTPVRLLRINRFNFLGADDYHRVTELRGDVWTLFISGPPLPGDDWGFLVNGQHMPWREHFVSENK